MSRPLLSFAYISSLATEFGAVDSWPYVSESFDVFAHVQFVSRPFPSAFGVHCARLCGTPISAWVINDCLLVRVPISSAGLSWFRVPPSGQWLVSAS